MTANAHALRSRLRASRWVRLLLGAGITGLVVPIVGLAVASDIVGLYDGRILPGLRLDDRWREGHGASRGGRPCLGPSAQPSLSRLSAVSYPRRARSVLSGPVAVTAKAWPYSVWPCSPGQPRAQLCRRSS